VPVRLICCFCVPECREIKTARGVQSATQRAFEAQAIAAGAQYAIVRSLDEALALLWERGYLARRLV
jgi:hypothetical protein